MNGMGTGLAVQGGRSWAVPALLTGTFARYVAASVIALAADASSFFVMLHAGLAPALAAASGFAVGIVVHWLVSSRVMFATGVMAAGPERRRQQALFLASALLGLGLTTLIVGVGAHVAINPLLAKAVAVAVSFGTTSRLRYLYVFRADYDRSLPA